MHVLPVPVPSPQCSKRQFSLVALMPGQVDEIPEATTYLKRQLDEFENMMGPVKKLKVAK